MSRFHVLSLSSILPLVLTLTMATNAHASGPVNLHWSAPDECPTSADVLAEVDRLLDARTTVDRHVLDVVANVKKKEDGTFVVRLEIPGSDGPRSRQVSAASCLALGRATALIVAMIVDPEAALAAPPPGGFGASGISSNVEPGKTIQEPGLPAHLPTGPVRFDAPLRLPYVRPLDGREAVMLTFRPDVTRFSVIGHVLGDLGSLPGPAVGISVGFGAIAGRLRIEAAVDYFGDKTSNYVALPNAGALVQFIGGHATLGLPIPLYPKLELVPRFRLDLGRFSGSSFGVSTLGQGTATAVSLGAGMMLAVRVAPVLRLDIGLDGLVFANRPTFIVAGLGVAHEPSVFVGRLALGAEVQF